MIADTLSIHSMERLYKGDCRKIQVSACQKYTCCHNRQNDLKAQVRRGLMNCRNTPQPIAEKAASESIGRLLGTK